MREVGDGPGGMPLDSMQDVLKAAADIKVLMCSARCSMHACISTHAPCPSCMRPIPESLLVDKRHMSQTAQLKERPGRQEWERSPEWIKYTAYPDKTVLGLRQGSVQDRLAK